MGDYTLKQIAESRQISRIWVFHTDHFEPYDVAADRSMIGLQHIDHWAKLVKKTPWRPTLFYHPQAYYWHEGKVYESSRKKTDQEHLHLLRDMGFEIQLHIHHENWIPEGLSPEQAGERLDELLILLRPLFRWLPNDPWCFIHGCWALNASDTTICNIEDEIRILLRHGCRADFSFPAGRSWCNPERGYPHTVLPVKGAAGYKSGAAQPLRIDRGTKAIQPGQRLLLWSNNPPYSVVSLDSPMNPALRVHALLAGSPVIEHTAFIKLHAHSLRSDCWVSADKTASPLASTEGEQLVASLTEAAAVMSCELKFVTANEVLDYLSFIDRDTYQEPPGAA